MRTATVLSGLILVTSAFGADSAQEAALEEALPGTGETKTPEETLDGKAKRFAEALKAKAESGDPCTKTEARALAQNLIKNKREGCEVYDFVIKDLDKYGLCTKKTGNSTGQIIVLKDG